MSELRNRIADVIYAADVDPDAENINPSVAGVIRASALRTADAVIRELGLTQETRYVTEWESR